MGIKQSKSTPPMEREIDYLLCDLCVNWGFCIPPVKAEEISRKSYWEAAEFAKEVVIAEGKNPEYEKQWVQKISNKFSERFGNEEIATATFVDRIRGIKETW